MASESMTALQAALSDKRSDGAPRFGQAYQGSPEISGSMVMEWKHRHESGKNGQPDQWVLERFGFPIAFVIVDKVTCFEVRVEFRSNGVMSMPFCIKQTWKEAASACNEQMQNWIRVLGLDPQYIVNHGEDAWARLRDEAVRLTNEAAEQVGALISHQKNVERITSRLSTAASTLSTLSHMALISSNVMQNPPQAEKVAPLQGAG